MNTISAEPTTDDNKSNLIDEIIRLSDFTFQRLPMLDIIGDRLAANIAEALPDLTKSLCEASVVQIDYVPLAQCIEQLPSPCLYAIAAGRPFGGEFLLGLDTTVLMSSIELMLGGDATELAPRTSEVFTEIEKGFGERICRLILGELGSSISVITESDLFVERMGADLDSINVTASASLCVRIRISVVNSGHAGTVDVVLPYDAMELFRPKLEKIHFGDPNENELDIWHGLLSNQIARANLELEAVLTELPATLGDLLGWKPGDTINLWVEDSHQAVVTYEDAPMFKAELGTRNNGNVAIQITEQLEFSEETHHGGDDH